MRHQRTRGASIQQLAFHKAELYLYEYCTYVQKRQISSYSEGLLLLPKSGSGAKQTIWVNSIDKTLDEEGLRIYLNFYTSWKGARVDTTVGRVDGNSRKEGKEPLSGSGPTSPAGAAVAGEWLEEERRKSGGRNLLKPLPLFPPS